MKENDETTFRKLNILDELSLVCHNN